MRMLFLALMLVCFTIQCHLDAAVLDIDILIPRDQQASLGIQRHTAAQKAAMGIPDWQVPAL